MAGQQHVVFQAQVGHQVELLEDEADVVGPQPVTLGRATARQIVPQQSDLAPGGLQHPAQQAQQRALAAAAGAQQQHVLAGIQCQAVDAQAGRGAARPGKAQVFGQQHGSGRIRCRGIVHVRRERHGACESR